MHPHRLRLLLETGYWQDAGSSSKLGWILSGWVQSLDWTGLDYWIGLLEGYETSMAVALKLIVYIYFL